MTLEQLIRGRYTFDQALSMYQSGRISEDTWEGYCYARRNLAYCYSNVGRAEAIRHATKHGLTLPYSDRPEWPEATSFERGAIDECADDCCEASPCGACFSF